jgi:hypothetical protein
VAHTARGSGITEGVPVSFTVVSVVEVIWVETRSGGLGAMGRLLCRVFLRGLEEPQDRLTVREVVCFEIGQNSVSY